MPLLNSVGFNLAKDKVVTSADGEKTLKVVAVGYGRTGTVRPQRSKSLIPMASGLLFSFPGDGRRRVIQNYEKRVGVR
jgi:hypothetical protein